MGRRARCNCSPIDDAMEKYHNDIGNRLSGIFLPTSNVQDTTDAFSMLTLDFRRCNSLRVAKTQPNPFTPISNACSKDDSCKENFQNSNRQSNDSAFHQPPPCNRSATLPALRPHSNNSNGSSSSKEKRNLMDKLARAIFQRKHTCARCQRKSRSCLQNKTFNASDKHYMCGRCREASKTMKSMVIGENRSTTSPVADDDSAVKNNTDVILPKPRVQLKDSGYETATSCSTVASGHSRFNSPYASANKQSDKPTSNVVCASGQSGCGDEADGISSKDNNYNHRASFSDSPASVQGVISAETPCPLVVGAPQTCNATNPNIGKSLLQHLFLAEGRDDGTRVLKQVKNRYVHNYDGYLDDQHSTSTPHCCDLISHHNSDHHTCQESNQKSCHAASQNDSDNQNSANSEGGTTNTKTVSDGGKICYICSTTTRPCFRLPWQGGWLCEECIDGML